MSPQELENIIQRAVERALKHLFIKYIKLTFGLGTGLILLLTVLGFVAVKLNGG